MNELQIEWIRLKELARNCTCRMNGKIAIKQANIIKKAKELGIKLE